MYSRSWPAAFLMMAAFFAAITGAAESEAGLIIQNANWTPITGWYDGVHQTEAGGGLMIGATLDGQALPNMYCVQWFQDIYLNTNYNYTANKSGMVDGYAIPNAGQIAWLLTHEAAGAATDLAKQAGLQALIWQLSSGQGPGLQNHSFVFDTTPGQNSAAVITAFQTYLNDVTQAYNANGHSLNNWIDGVKWISPKNANGLLTIQGQACPIPEPSSLALFGVGIAGLAYRSSRRRSVSA